MFKTKKLTYRLNKIRGIYESTPEKSLNGGYTSFQKEKVLHVKGTLSIIVTERGINFADDYVTFSHEEIPEELKSFKENGRLFKFKKASWCHNAKEEIIKGVKESNDFYILKEEDIEIQLPSRWFNLGDSYGLKAFKKYEPLLLIISDVPYIKWKRMDEGMKSKMNINEAGLTEFLQGDFFVTKKGTKAFRIKDDGKNILFRTDFKYPPMDKEERERLQNNGEVLHYARRTSNGGGLGWDYYVVNEDWTYIPDIDNI